jgi:hypothetical protein
MRTDPFELRKETPGRGIGSAATARVISHPCLGGLHHPTTQRSEIGCSEKAAFSGVVRASVDNALRRVGNILQLAHPEDCEQAGWHTITAVS